MKNEIVEKKFAVRGINSVAIKQRKKCNENEETAEHTIKGNEIVRTVVSGKKKKHALD